MSFDLGGLDAVLGTFFHWLDLMRPIVVAIIGTTLAIYLIGKVMKAAGMSTGEEE